MWNERREIALVDYMNRGGRRTFEHGPIAGLYIQEYWHPDVYPRGGEQKINFYRGELSFFEDVYDFATVIELFEHEDGVTHAARQSFSIEKLSEIAQGALEDIWKECAAKVKAAPQLLAHEIESSFAISDEWNQRSYVGKGLTYYYACCWSTSA